MNLTPADFFGIAAFTLHLIAYALYAFFIFRGTVRPNAASWLMWLIGGWVEYLTYDAIGESHWSTSALPFACVIGLTIIFTTTFTMQAHAWFLGRKREMHYHTPERNDYFLALVDLSTLVIWLKWSLANIANIIAVGSSIVTFIPIWRTTYETHEENAWPWLIWCAAYSAMFVAVIIEGGDDLVFKLFYPVYYFALHLVVALLCFKTTRRFIHSIMLKSTRSVA
jgi:hypothetical protein